MSLLLSPDELLARRSTIAASPELAALDRHLTADVARLLAQPLYVPEQKALLSRWGAHCRDDEAELAFDPFSPHAHRCRRCGIVTATEQSHRWWVYWYQLWLAERVLVERMATSYCRLRRAHRFEVGAVRDFLDDCLHPAGEEPDEQTAKIEAQIQALNDEIAEGLDATAQLSSLGISLSLSRIYMGVVFEETTKPAKSSTKKTK